MKILYIAKYAPIKDNIYLKTEYVEEYVKYHKQLFNELSKFATVIASNDFEDIIKYRNEIDFIFSVYNKAPFRGSEILSSSLAEFYQIPYLGATPNIRAIAEDKHLAKMVALKAKVKTPKWQVFNQYDQIDYIDIKFKPPYFIKPRFGANSDYIELDCIQYSKCSAKEKIKELLIQGVDVIVEEYIKGVYYTVPAWYDKSIYVFKSIRQFSDTNIVTNRQKTYQDAGLYRTINVRKELQNKLENNVKSIYELLLPLDFARFDFLINEDTMEIYFLELNICCSLSNKSTFAISAENEGYSYQNFIKKIINISFSRQGIPLLED